MNPSIVVRRASSALLVVLAAALAAGAVRAHRFDASLPEPLDGAPAALGAEVGDDLPFEPFAFAVVGAPRGDAAALARALDAASRDAPLAFAVVFGDVLPSDAARLAPFAATLRRVLPVVLLAGPHDAWPDDADPRLAALAQPVLAFAFTSHGCTFRGGDASPDVPRGDDVGDPSAATFVFARDDEPRSASHVLAPPASDAHALAYEVVHVGSPTAWTRTPGRVARRTSPAALWDELTLGALRPHVAGAAGLAAALAAAFLLACGGLVLSRRPASP